MGGATLFKVNVTAMFHKVITAVAVFLALSGCVTSSPEALFNIPDVPNGAGQKTGQYPKIGEVPAGQTSQLTKAQVQDAKQQLSTDVKRGNAQAAQNSEAAYRAEVQALQSLAAEQKKKRLSEIESRKF